MNDNSWNKEYAIHSVKDFIKFVEDMNSIGYTWFRGQMNDTWDIEPRLIRKDNDRTSNTEVQEIIKKIKHFKSLIDKAEYTINHCDKYKKIKSLDLNNIQLMMLAQHHGLTTPFLDWTTNPNIALFFSLDGYNISKSNPVIYATDPTFLNYISNVDVNGDFRRHIFNSEDTIITSFINSLLRNGIADLMSPLAIKTNLDFSHRITFQSGKFTMMGPKMPYESKKFKDKEYPISDHHSQKTNRVAIISPDVINELRTYLESFGYTTETVYRLKDEQTDIINDLFQKISKN